MATRVLVTPRSLTATGLDSIAELEPLRALGIELLAGPAGRVPSESELLGLVPGIHGWLAGVEPISALVFAAAPNLRVISRNGVGADAVDLEAAHLLGVEVVLARGANSRGVAELTTLLILASLRDLPRSNAAMKQGRWQRTLGREMPDITLGIIGFGAIGRLVAQFAFAMGAKVVAHDPFTPVGANSLAEEASFAQVFERADVVSLHCPPPPGGSALVTGGALATMRERAVLVNTARSSLVDDSAVLEALESGRLSFYAVDAFDIEPPALTPLLTHERTILTPHLGGFTAASTRRATEQAVANLIATLGM